MKSPLKLKSIENASVIRKFSVLFTMMTLLPFLLLAGAFFFFVQRGKIEIDLDFMFWAVVVVGLFAFIGFLSMRKTLLNLITVSQGAKDILAGDFTKRINLKGSGDNEVT